MTNDQPSCERILINAALREAMDGGTAVWNAGQTSAAIQPDADSFPGHTLMEEIHRGGQGIVFRARQKSTGRDVAIKLMREGPYSGPVSKSRFEREVHILARLKHRNIVTIHESAIVNGNHYFVMDYISGQPLDQFVSQRDWPVNDVLRLFMKVCTAVNEAHVRGIIHRDLKPSNILIDNDGEPHILDFGLAKFESEDPVDGPALSRVTQTGQFVGSLPWASPEQADGAANGIDLRSDTYSLGVILYQALTGKFPYRVVGSMRDVLGNILQTTPASMRTLNPALDTDIETITRKCLEKDPDRRYQTAGSLAGDIDRYLTNQPILARPATTLYQLKKLVNRNRLPFGLITALFLSVIGFSIWMAVLYQRSEAQRMVVEQMRDAETAQRRVAEANLIRAESAEHTARDSADTANEVVSFLVGLFEISDPNKAKGSSVTAREILDRGAARIREQLSDQPDVRASMMNIIGVVYRSLGLYDEALPLLEESLQVRKGLDESGDLKVAESMNELSALHRVRGEYEPAEQLGRTALSIRRAALGPDHPKSLASLNNIAMTQKARGQLEEAEILLREYVRRVESAFGEEHQASVTSLNNLALLLEEQGRYAEAESLFREARSRGIKHLGELHPFTMQTTGNLGRLLHQRGELAEAEELLREATKQHRRVLGDEHPSTQTMVSNLGLLLKDNGELEEAMALFREASEVRTRVLGPEHPDTLSSVNNMALLYLGQRQFAGAEKEFRRAWEAYDRTLGDRHPQTIGVLGNLAASIKAQLRYDEAEKYYRKAMEGTRDVLGDDHPTTLVVMNNLAGLYKAQGKLDEAGTLLRRVVDVQRKTLGEEHVLTLTAKNNLASTLKAMGAYAESEKLYRDALEGRIRQLGEQNAATIVSMNNLAKVLMVQEAYEEAEQWLSRALRESSQSLQSAVRPIVQGNYGVCLIRLGRFAEAEQALLAAHQALLESRGAQHKRTVVVVKGLIELYQTWGKPDRAQEYRSILESPSESRPAG